MKIATPATIKITRTKWLNQPAIVVTHTSGATRTIYRDESVAKGYYGAYRVQGRNGGLYSTQSAAKEAVFAELTANDNAEPEATEETTPAATVTTAETTYILTADEVSNGTLYTVTAYADKDGSEESVIDQRFFDSEAAATAFMSAAMTPAALEFVPIDGLQGEYTATFTPDFAMNLTQGVHGWSVTTTEHESVDVLSEYDTEDGDGVRWVKDKQTAINRALEFAQWFIACIVENWQDNAQCA